VNHIWAEWGFAVVIVAILGLTIGRMGLLIGVPLMLVWASGRNLRGDWTIDVHESGLRIRRGHNTDEILQGDIRTIVLGPDPVWRPGTCEQIPTVAVLDGNDKVLLKIDPDNPWFRSEPGCRDFIEYLIACFPLAKLVDPQQILDHTGCLTCGYELRGCSGERCPECATVIRQHQLGIIEKSGYR
jgi:hypothetical protein